MIMRTIPGFADASTDSTSEESSRNSIVVTAISTNAFTVPRTGIHQLWRQRGIEIGSLSSVPHVPDSEPEHREGFPEPGRAFAVKNECPSPAATPGSAQRAHRLQRRCATPPPLPLYVSTAQPAVTVETVPHSAPHALPRSVQELRQRLSASASIHSFAPFIAHLGLELHSKPKCTVRHRNQSFAYGNPRKRDCSWVPAAGQIISIEEPCYSV